MNIGNRVRAKTINRTGTILNVGTYTSLVCLDEKKEGVTDWILWNTDLEETEESE